MDAETPSRPCVACARTIAVVLFALACGGVPRVASAQTDDEGATGEEVTGEALHDDLYRTSHEPFAEHEVAPLLAELRARAASEPIDVASRLDIAEARERLGDFEAALLMLEQGIDAGEGDAVLGAYGALLVRLERFTEASDVLVALVETRGSDDIEDRYWLARSFEGRGRHSRARTEDADVARRGAAAPADERAAVAVARSLWHLGRVRDANNAFREALSAFPDSVAVRVAWAELFVDRYRPDEAIRLYGEALTHDPLLASTMVDLANAVFTSQYDRAAATALLDRATEIAPALPAAAELRAAMLIDDRQFSEAETVLDDLLARFPERRRAASLRASAANLAGDAETVATIEAELLARDPLYSDFYVTVGQGAVRHFRYREAVDWFRRAVDLDADNAAALVALGVAYSRVGEDERAIRLLQRAFENDPFNVEAYNMATLWEQSLVHYIFVDDEEIGGLRYRFHESVAAHFTAYIPPLMRDAWRTYEERYAFTPDPPVSIEVFEDRESFSVRSVGLPHAGQHGICFGHLVTSRSPSDRNFNWHQVLAHELSHVFSLQASNYRVPRWFTEGLAEYDTMLSRPEWWREHDMALAQALRADRLIPIAGLDRAFVDVERPEQVLEAYYQASLVVAFIGETFGYESIRDILTRFAAGDDTPAALEHALGMRIDELDQRFAESLRQRLAPLLVLVEPAPHLAPPIDAAERMVATSPQDSSAAATLALSQLAVGAVGDALASVERALVLNPDNAVALYLRGHAAAAAGREADAVADLERLVAGPHDSASAQLTLARLRQRRGDERGALLAAMQATLLSPRDVDAWSLRVELERAVRDEADLTTLQQLVALDQHAASDARELASRYLAQNRDAEAFRAARQASDTDPFDSDGHFLYGTAAFRLSNWAIARRELEFALETATGQREAILTMLVTTYESLGAEDEALRTRRLLGGAAP